MAINFLDGITVGGELTTTGGTYNITTTSGSSSLYLLNLTRTTTSLTTVGSVGIGTTSPNRLLTVQTTGSGSYLALNSSSNNTTIGSDVFGSFIVYDDSSSTYRMVIDQTTGNVGIGTTDPSQKLTVAGTIMSTATSNATLILQDTTHSDITIKGDSGIFSVSNGSAGQNITMLYNGDVGIGTTAPTTKLDVNGTFQATSVRSTGGGDGGLVLRQWTYASNYASLATNGMQNQEYCIISDGTNTFVGAGTGGALRLRGPANDSSPQIEINGSLCKVDTGDFKVEDGSIAVGNITNSTTDGRIDASNDVVAFSTSDIRLKDNIKTIDKALDKVNSIQGIEFDWIEKEEVHGNSGHDIGVIAQEIEKILPDVVTTRDSGYKAVKYEKIVPLLIEAIKDLSKQVDGLKRLI